MLPAQLFMESLKDFSYSCILSVSTAGVEVLTYYKAVNPDKKQASQLV